MATKETYNSFEIQFDEKREVWFAHVWEEGDKGNSSENRVENASLKKLKELLDKAKRRKFERMAIFVRTNRYRLGGGRDKSYESQFEEAMLTSIAPGGNMFFVRKGSKHSEKTYISSYYNSRSTELVLDTPANRKVIADIETAGRIEWEAEIKQEKLRDDLLYVDGQKLYEQVYSKKLNSN